jgi:hypothetical protein
MAGPGIHQRRPRSSTASKPTWQDAGGLGPTPPGFDAEKLGNVSLLWAWETASMEWTDETGVVVEWDWAEPRSDDSGEPAERYAIRIRLDGRRLRGAESQAWKQRIATEFVG